MRRRNAVPAAILAVLLVGSVFAWYLTRASGTRPAAPAKGPVSDQAVAVDSQLLETANQVAALAETSDEQKEAQEAEHLADHELDQAFATALRQAASYRAPGNGPLRDLVSRINELKLQIAAEQVSIAQLTKQTTASAADHLDLANAQLALDQDELADAQQDLARQGGDPHATLEKALQQHEATQHQTTQAFKGASASPTATLVEQVRAWFLLGSTDRLVLAAGQQAASQGIALSSQHNEIEKQFISLRSDAGTQANVSTADRVASLHRSSDQKKTLAELDQRIQDCQQLAGVYHAWSTLIETRRGLVLHLLVGSLVEILAILLAATLAILVIRRFFQETDRKRLHQVRMITTLAVQLVALLLMALVLFGAPTQLPTIIGLTTAGLTVVLRDFIVAFLGWFALMGKNGIRVGDWVEINGVSGEVIDIGLLKTVLLEQGNWTDTGHPTGRQVGFSNSFAMEGHYFNFSTAGQWLWDELEVILTGCRRSLPNRRGDS
jgi:Mechanosensitive ion channel